MEKILGAIGAPKRGNWLEFKSGQRHRGKRSTP